MELCGFRFLNIDDDYDLLEKSYRLRYEVYCHETQFLNSSEFPDGIEKDKYDDHSIHVAAIDYQNDVIGTIRLILDSKNAFPLESKCQNYDRSKINFPRSQIGEISRLVVARQWRRRKNDELYGMSSYHHPTEANIPERRNRPIILFGLYKILYMKSKELGLSHWYAAMEQHLQVTLRKFSFVFDAIGPEQDYYGPVTPFLGDITKTEKILYNEKPEVLHLMAFGLNSQLLPKLGFAFFLKNVLILKLAKLTGKL